MESFTKCSSGCSATQNGVLKLFCVAMVVASCKGKAATAAPCEHFQLVASKKNHKKKQPQSHRVHGHLTNNGVSVPLQWLCVNPKFGIKSFSNFS